MEKMKREKPDNVLLGGEISSENEVLFRRDGYSGRMNGFWYGKVQKNICAVVFKHCRSSSSLETTDKIYYCGAK